MLSQSAIFGPFFATVILTFFVWLTMYLRRIRFIRANELTPDDLTPARLAELSPPSVTNPSDNLKNLFEIPVLFYAMALYLFATNQVDAGYVAAGWVFAAFRWLHSGVHCTVNIVMVRFYLYLVSTLAVWIIGGRAALSHFAG